MNRLSPLMTRLFTAVLLVSASRQINTARAFSQKQPAFKPQSSSTAATDKSSKQPLTFQYTHLEVNGMLWQIPEADVSLVIDPIASQLDFGVPWGYRANKKVLGERETIDTIVQAAPTHCLLSQGLDDHTHLASLKKLVTKMPDLQFIVAPSAREKIAPIIKSARTTVLPPGETLSLKPNVQLTATEGALVGPPWQHRENGWLLRVQDRCSIYMEPHADVTDCTLRRGGLTADIVISPVIQQSLPAQVPELGQFKLVYGGKRTLEIVKALGASVVIPLGNGELDTTGPFAGLVQATGSVEEFEQLVQKENAKRRDDDASKIRVERPTPGVALKVQL